MSCDALPRTNSNFGIVPNPDHVPNPVPGSSSDSSSGSSSGLKRGRCESPNSKPSGSQKKKRRIENLMSLYIFVKLLGCGAFGKVNLMQHRISGTLYAVKVIKKDQITDSKTRYEIELGMNLDSKHVCKVHSYHEDDEHFYIFMEYLEGMDLCDFIRKDPKFFMRNPKIFWVVVESILHGLAYLHSKGIAHMDIKPENVFLLLDDKGNIVGVKLIDLGLAIDITKKIKCFRGTNTYMAPEFFHFCWSTGFPADIWSLGITAFAMLRASLPISSRKKDRQCAQSEIYAKIGSLLTMKSFTPFLKKNESIEISEIEDFIKSCFSVDPQKRPTADDLLKMIPVTSSQLST